MGAGRWNDHQQVTPMSFFKSLAVFLDEYVAVIALLLYMYFYSLWRVTFMVENTAHIALKMSDTFKHNY